MRLRNLVFLIVLVWVIGGLADEGMWPLSEIRQLNLKKQGLKMDPGKIYNPDGVSLIDAIVKVGGCTGSFVSPEGLILTNHHCAYRAAQAASTPEHDYIRDGFLARSREEEIPAKGYTVRITESYRDVSREVLGAVTPEMDYAARTRAIRRKIKEIVAEAERKNPGKRAEVSEMFVGKTYVLFLYTYLKDVRLVYVPPRSIGEFGGEEDNWIWPRHTGDFSFLRVYVAPDGSPAEYDPENVPYRPRQFLSVNPEGVDKGDFLFILGYPGRTYRHRTSYFLAFEEDVRLPFVASLYDWQIQVMEKAGRQNREVMLKHLSRIKSRANVMKNYRGKLLGLKRLRLVEKKRAEEKALQAFIQADSVRREKYGQLLTRIEQVYREMRKTARRDLILDYLPRSSNLFYFALTIYKASIERAKPDLEREAAFMDRNYPRTKERILLALKDYYEPTDRILLKDMLLRAARLPGDQRIKVLDDLIGAEEPETAIDRLLDAMYAKTMLDQERIVYAALEQPQESLKVLDDPFINLARNLYPAYRKLKEERERRKGELDPLLAKLVEVKKQFLQKKFVPDANGTLRLTYGHVRGYSPRDAVYYQPISTLRGVVEKTTGEEPFDTPAALLRLIERRDFGRFVLKCLGSVPVGILYDTDTTGGNSGSPILDARGRLIGVNFDRAFEATINDYAWSEDYSRSIGVDIRYVLWVTQKFGGATWLLEEMGVPLD